MDLALSKINSFQKYVEEVRKFPLLSKQEEKALFKQLIETQDQQVALKLITSNLKLVLKIAGKYKQFEQSPHFMLDMIQEGNIGLMHAVKKFDPEKNVSFCTYAACWIKSYVVKFILKNKRMVSFLDTKASRKLFGKLRKEQKKFLSLGHTPSPKLLAERLDSKESDVIEMQEHLGHYEYSIYQKTNESLDSEREVLILDTLSSFQASPEELVISKEQKEQFKLKIDSFLKTLQKPIEKDIVLDHLLEDVTLDSIGEKYNISKQRVHQIKQTVIDKLRKYVQEDQCAL